MVLGVDMRFCSINQRAWRDDELFTGETTLIRENSILVEPSVRTGREGIFLLLLEEPPESTILIHEPAMREGSAILA
jgi:hypothetical protein